MQWTTDDLVPNIIRRLCQRQRAFASVVSPDGGLEHISVADVHHASNRAAWFLHQNLKVEDERFYYMGPSDIRYLIWTIAAMKTRKCVVCPSPGNTIPSNLRLFGTVGATQLLYAPESTSSLQPLLDSLGETTGAIPTPSYSELFNGEAVDEFPFPFSFDEIGDKPCMGLHTSGTSGHPKPIYWNHTAIATIVSLFDFDTLPNPPKRQHLLLDVLVGNNVFLPFPLYHFGGIGFLLRSFLTDTTVILPATGTRLSPGNFAKMLSNSMSDCTLTPPSILEAMLSSPSDLEVVAKLKHVAYSGGPLNPILGKRLADILPHMFPLYGCTEGGGPYLESTGDNTYWNGMKFIDMGQRMEEVIPGLYEMVVTRTDAINQSQAYFHTCPHLEEFRTSDLFAPIPGSDGWWIFHGRTDNWITMSNGYKMDPTAIENTISAHPRVMGALVAGSHQFRLCLLIELRPESMPKSDKEREEILNEMWPTIDEANKSAPKFGRVPRELVLFASDAKPFSRASKGTVQRRLTIAAYEKEIGDLYSKIGDGLLTSGLPPLKSTTDADAVQLFLRAVFAETLDLKDLAVDEDLFAKGLDSLSIFLLTARIKAGLRVYKSIPETVFKKIDYTLLYTSPTISRLAERLLSLILVSGGSEDNIKRSDVDDVHDLLAKYSAQIPGILQRDNAHQMDKDKDKDKDKQKQAIVLTGSRGSLGSYILSTLLARPDISKVYCLNRRGPENAPAVADQHIASFKARGLPDLEPQLDRVVFLETDLAMPNLGLKNAEEYATLAEEATAIIHNAWPVNFVMPVRSFEPHIQGLMNLFRLAQDGTGSSDDAPAPVLFVSSIAAAVPFSAAAGSKPSQEDAVPERVLGDAGAFVQPGYGQSKFICEKLMEHYVTSSSSSSSSRRGLGAILRVGQVCGPLEGPGIWNPWEWAPSMILSSKRLGVAPASVGPNEIDWIPVDVLGRVICELVDDVVIRAQLEFNNNNNGNNNGNNVTVYNVQNPRATTWRALLPAVKRVVPETVSPAEWIARLERSRGTSSGSDQNPGVKLIDFYKQAFLGDGDGDGDGDESMVRKWKGKGIVTEKNNLLRCSRTAREMEAVRAEDLEKWMEGWGL